MKTYRVIIFRDCHAAHNIKFRNQSALEAESIRRLAIKEHHRVTVREEKL